MTCKGSVLQYLLCVTTVVSTSVAGNRTYGHKAVRRIRSPTVVSTAQRFSSSTVQMSDLYGFKLHDTASLDTAPCTNESTHTAVQRYTRHIAYNKSGIYTARGRARVRQRRAAAQGLIGCSSVKCHTLVNTEDVSNLRMNRLPRCHSWKGGA